MLPIQPNPSHAHQATTSESMKKIGELSGKRYIPIDRSFLEEKEGKSLLATGIIKPLSLAAYLGCMVIENSAWLVGGATEILTKKENINALIDCALDVTTNVAEETNRRSTVEGVVGMVTQTAMSAAGGAFGDLLSWAVSKKDQGVLKTGGYVAGNLIGEGVQKKATEAVEGGISLGIQGLAYSLVPSAVLGTVTGSLLKSATDTARSTIYQTVTAANSATMCQVKFASEVGYKIAPLIQSIGKVVSKFFSYTSSTAGEVKEGIWSIYKQPEHFGTSIARTMSPWSGWLMREWGDAEVAEHLAAFERGKTHDPGRQIHFDEFCQMSPQEQESILWLCQNTSRTPISPEKAREQCKKLLDWQQAINESKGKQKLKPFIEWLIKRYNRLSMAQKTLLTPASLHSLLPETKLRFLKFIHEQGAALQAVTHDPSLRIQLERLSKESAYPPSDSSEYDIQALERLAVITFNYNYMGERSRKFLDRFSPFSEGYFNALTSEAKGALFVAIMEKAPKKYSAVDLEAKSYGELSQIFNELFSAAERFKVLSLVQNKSPLLFKSLKVLELTEEEYQEVEKRVVEQLLKNTAEGAQTQESRQKLYQNEALRIIKLRSQGPSKTKLQATAKKSAATFPKNEQETKKVDSLLVHGKVQRESGAAKSGEMGRLGQGIQWLFGSTGMILGMMADIGASNKNPFTDPKNLVPLVHATATALEVAGRYKFTQTLLASQIHKFPWISQSVTAINQATIWASTKFAHASHVALSYLLDKEEALHKSYLLPFFQKIENIAEAKEILSPETLIKTGKEALRGMHEEFAKSLPRDIPLSDFESFYKENYQTAFEQAKASIDIDGMSEAKKQALILQKTYATLATCMGSKLQLEVTHGLQSKHEKKGLLSTSFDAFWGLFNLSEKSYVDSAAEKLAQKSTRPGADFILATQNSPNRTKQLEDALETLDSTKNSWSAYAQEKGLNLATSIYQGIRDEITADLSLCNSALKYASQLSDKTTQLALSHQELVMQGPQKLADSLKEQGASLQATEGGRFSTIWKTTGFVAEKVGTALEIANGRFYVRVATRTAAQLLRIFGVEAAYLIRPAFKNLSTFVKRSSNTLGGEVGEFAEALYGAFSFSTVPDEKRIQNFLNLEPREREYIEELVQVTGGEQLLTLDKPNRTESEEKERAKQILIHFDTLGPQKEICLTPSILATRPPEIRTKLVKLLNLPETKTDLELCQALWQRPEGERQEIAELTPEEFYALPSDEQKDLLFLATTSAQAQYDSLSAWAIDYNRLFDSISKDKLKEILQLHAKMKVQDRRKLKPTTLMKFGPAKMREIRALLEKTGNLSHLSNDQREILTYLDKPFDSTSADIRRFQLQAVNYLCYLFNRKDWVSLKPDEKEQFFTLSSDSIRELSNAEQLLLLQELSQEKSIDPESTQFLRNQLLDNEEKLSDSQVDAIAAAFNSLPLQQKIALYDSQFSQRPLLRLYSGEHANALIRSKEATDKAKNAKNKTVEAKLKRKADQYLQKARGIQSIIESTYFKDVPKTATDKTEEEMLDKLNCQFIKQLIGHYPQEKKIAILNNKLEENKRQLEQGVSDPIRGAHLDRENRSIERLLREEQKQEEPIGSTSTNVLAPPVVEVDVVTKIRWWLRSLFPSSSDSIGKWGKSLKSISGNSFTTHVFKGANGIIVSWNEDSSLFKEQFILKTGLFGNTYLVSKRTGQTFARIEELHEYLKGYIKTIPPLTPSATNRPKTAVTENLPSLKNTLRSIRKLKYEEGSLTGVSKKYILCRSGSQVTLEKRAESGIKKRLQEMKLQLFKSNYETKKNLAALDAIIETGTTNSQNTEELKELALEYGHTPETLFTREELLEKIRGHATRLQLNQKLQTEAERSTNIPQLAHFASLLRQTDQILMRLDEYTKMLNLISNEETKRIVEKEIRTQRDALTDQLTGLSIDSIKQFEIPTFDLKNLEETLFEDRILQKNYTSKVKALKKQFEGLIATTTVISGPLKKLLKVQLHHLEEMEKRCNANHPLSWKYLNRLQTATSFLATFPKIEKSLTNLNESSQTIEATLKNISDKTEPLLETSETKNGFQSRMQQIREQLREAEKSYVQQFSRFISLIDRGTSSIESTEWLETLKVDDSGALAFKIAAEHAARLAQLKIPSLEALQKILSSQTSPENTPLQMLFVKQETTIPLDRGIKIFAEQVAKNIESWRFETEPYLVEEERIPVLKEVIDRFPVTKEGASLPRFAIQVIQEEIKALQPALANLFKDPRLEQSPPSMEALEYLELITDRTHESLQAINQRLKVLLNMHSIGTYGGDEGARFQEADVLANALTKLLLSTIESSALSPSKKKLLAGSLVGTYTLTFRANKASYTKEDTSQNVHFFIATIKTLMESVPDWKKATATVTEGLNTKPLEQLLEGMQERYVLGGKNPTEEGTKPPSNNQATEIGTVIKGAMDILQMQTGKNIVKARCAGWILERLSGLQLQGGTPSQFQEWVAASKELLGTIDRDTTIGQAYEMHNQLGFEIGRLSMLHGQKEGADLETYLLLQQASQLQYDFDQEVYRTQIKNPEAIPPTIDSDAIRNIIKRFTEKKEVLQLAIQKREAEKASRFKGAFLESRFNRLMPNAHLETQEEELNALKSEIKRQKLPLKQYGWTEYNGVLNATDAYIGKLIQAIDDQAVPTEGEEVLRYKEKLLWTLDTIQLFNSQTFTPGLLGLHLLAAAHSVAAETPLHRLLGLDSKETFPKNEFSDLQAVSLEVLRQTVESLEGRKDIPKIEPLKEILYELEKLSQRGISK